MPSVTDGIASGESRSPRASGGVIAGAKRITSRVDFSALRGCVATNHSVTPFFEI
jgi:hypothetical protein